MKRKIVWSFAVWMLVSSKVYSNENGRICIAPLPIDLREAAIAPWDIVDSEGNTDFYVSLNKREPIQVSVKEVRWIEAIDVSETHNVTISKGNEPRERFTFEMKEYNFKNKSKIDLCLFVNDLYLTWQLYKVESTGSWCPCWLSEGKK